MALKRGSGSGAGGALIVAALPPVAGQAVGAQFWLEEEETLWRVEEYTPEGMPGTVTKTPFVTADFDASTFGGNPPTWGGVVSVAPAGVAGQSVVFWDSTAGHTLGTGIAVGRPLKYVSPDGTVATFTLQHASFNDNYPGGIQWFGDPDANSFSGVTTGDATTDTEAEIITILDSDSEVSDRVNDATWINLYFDATDAEVYRLTGHVRGAIGDEDASLAKSALVTADFNTNYNATHTYQWSGVMNLTPAGISGVAQVFWNTLSPTGSKYSLRVGTGTAVPFTWENGSFSESYAGGILWIGDPDESDPDDPQAGTVDSDTEAEILAILDGNAALGTKASDATVLTLYFDATDQEVYKVTAFNPSVEGEKALRYTQLAAGSGGGSPLVTTMKTVLGEPEEIWSGDIAAATADTYVFVTDDDSNRVILPDDADIAFVVIDHGSEDAGEPPVGTTHWIPIEVFNALTAAAALTATNQVTTSDFFRGTATGSFTRRDFSWGITALRELVFTSDSSAESIVGGSVSIVRRFSVIATAEGGGGGGGAGHSGYIAPKDEYDADDLGKRVWENGIDKVVELFTQAGHSRVVVFQDLANAASALNADGTNVTTGVAGEFLGIFANLSAVPALSVTDGSWAGFVGSGDFEIQDPTGFYSSEHWNSYNPFRGSGMRPWSTITLADATTLDHVPFTDPDTGIVSDWRIVNSSGHAERYTTAVGEAFFVQNERLIRMVIEFTEHADDEVRYRAVPYRPPGVDPSIAGSANVTIGGAEANQMIDTTLQVPLAPWFFFNLGEGASSVENGEWHRVRTSQLNAKDDVVASEVPEAANSLQFSDIVVTDE